MVRWRFIGHHNKMGKIMIKGKLQTAHRLSRTKDIVPMTCAGSRGKKWKAGTLRQRGDDIRDATLRSPSLSMAENHGGGFVGRAGIWMCNSFHANPVGFFVRVFHKKICLTDDSGGVYYAGGMKRGKMEDFPKSRIAVSGL